MQFEKKVFEDLPTVGNYSLASLDVLSQSGGSPNMYGVTPSLVVQFPTKENLVIKSRPLYEGSTLSINIIGVMRGTRKEGQDIKDVELKPGFVNISAFRRVDADRNTQCPVCTELLDSERFPNDQTRVEYLLGKTVAGTGSFMAETFVYDKNVRTENREKREFPILEFV